MKKLFAMSLFALSTLSMFGGNIEKNNASTPAQSEITEQVGTVSCYHITMIEQYYVNHQSGPAITVLDEFKLYTEQGFEQRLQELDALYINTFSFKTGNGVLYTVSSTKSSIYNCISVSTN
ncbi:hypothetical protein [Flavobacterium sp. NKUCC04_CG]|uniref:hypothetical protein n=1 Tax=Flavobacterium sp. NKUCC04_CG TaxID=2842121 RepID=UPI001C5BF5B1|nr:hypothetical protein [Flavobacterium sp. NKUCC04_CG]MBW3518708.1 hypothetical protein [Flavobacterium sp. NKUCC04_CG]